MVSNDEEGTGWLFEQMESTARDVALWPKWMRREAGVESSLKVVEKYVKDVGRRTP